MTPATPRQCKPGRVLRRKDLYYWVYVGNVVVGRYLSKDVAESYAQEFTNPDYRQYVLGGKP